jgi:hypothetical protein
MYSSKSVLIVSTLRTRRSTFSSGPSSLQLCYQGQHLVQILRMSFSCTCQSVWACAWGAPAHATWRVRAGVWVLGRISRSFVRIRACPLAAAGWRRPGRAVRRPRFHDDDALPDVDVVDAWMEEPYAPIGGPRTSVVCF